MDKGVEAKRMSLAEQILRLADDVDYGASPIFVCRELRKIAQIVEPGCSATPTNQNESARWIVNDERLSALELEVKDLRATLQKQSDAFGLFARAFVK